MTAATRRQLQAATKRLEKSLDDAGTALQALGKDAGQSGSASYKKLTATLKSLRSDAGKANKALIKDLDKLRSAVTQKSSTTKKSSTARKRTTTRRTSAAKRPAARSGGRRAS